MIRFALALVVMFGLPCVALAEVPREVGQVELRRMVAAGQSLSLSRIMQVVSRSAAGEPVDVRLFDSSGLFYRVVVMQPSGKLLRLVLDAQTGEVLADTSPAATRVRAAATHAKAAAAASKSKSKSGQGNSDSAGNGGNSGGNGNAGGKGNGNGKN